MPPAAVREPDPGRPVAFAGLIAWLFAGLIATGAAVASTFPDYAQVRADWRSSDLRVLDRNGALLQEIRVDHHARRADWTPLDEISPAMIAAVLRAEDKRFFEHAGVDWLAAGKAALTNWLNETPRGASTISMQLAALLDARYRASGGRRDVTEKWLQMGAARELEKRWRKTEILEAYLNLAPFRGELTGIDATSRGLFDKRPSGLDRGEALILASLLRSPAAKPADVARRACALADTRSGSPTCPELRALTLNTLSGRYPVAPAANLAPHLAERLRAEAAPGRREFRASLDAGLQRATRAILAEQLAFLAAREVRDAAALVLDNASGEVLAYVSLSGPESTSPASDGVRAPRQAGSTLKPFLYGLALEKRLLTAASPLDDAPLTLATASGEYAPRNYDQSHRGLVGLRAALAGSLNIPAVRVLELVGLEAFADRLARLGFQGLTEAADFYGPSLALGSLDVRLEELTNAYRALANGGLHGPMRFNPGTGTGRPTRVINRESAWLIADILADRQARAITFGLENPLATRYWSAVKTGTSKDMRDNWAIGFSSRYTVGVWVGNFSGAPMRDVSGISGAAPAWAAIMNLLHADTDSRQPKPPPGLILRTVATPGAPAYREWFLAGTEPDDGIWRAATPPARIVSPTDGAILALDPDIPPERQALRPRAQYAPAGAYWRIAREPADRDGGDGVTIADHWPLQRGRHRLSLHAPDDSVLESIGLEVR